MHLKQTPQLLAFLSASFMDTDMESDAATARAFLESASSEKCEQIVSQARQILGADPFPIDELGSEANRWFGSEDEGREWLSGIVSILEEAVSEDASGDVVVKDSNGAVLAEGDTVQVIKDLKVKGGSSDLKRGTTIKKIHLVGDPEAIECRVDGSTLVLKTCFLRKV